MTLAAHQPQYLPWLGYFHKIDKCDIFVFLDNVQYERRGYQNRNKIRTSQGWKWLSVPVASSGRYTQKMKDVFIDKNFSWQRSHWGIIYENYKEAPFFTDHEAFFSRLFSKEWERLIDLNIEIIRYILMYLGIKKDILLESDLGIGSSRNQRIIDICKKLSADTYLSGIGGMAYLEQDGFKKNQIDLIFQEFMHPEYRQVFEPFLPNMSMIDLLFNCGKESINILRS